MNTNKLIRWLNQLEKWLDEKKSRHHLLPLRITGYLLLFVVIIFSNMIALIRWPFAALSRKMAEKNNQLQNQTLNNSIIEADAVLLKQILKKHELVLIDFWAEWCGPCVMMNKPLKKLAESEDTDCTVIKINTIKHKELADRYNVKGLPTLLLVRKNKELKRFAGALSYQELKSFITL